MPRSRLPAVRLMAALPLCLLALAATSCEKGNTALLHVTADGPVDQYFLYVRYDDATPKQILKKTGWTRASRDSVFGTGDHTLGLNLPRPGRYTLVLLGVRGSVPCLLGNGESDAAVPSDGGFGDGGAPFEDFGSGQQFFWARSDSFQGNEELTVHLTEVLHGTGGAPGEDRDCDGFPDVSTWPLRANPSPPIATTLLDCNDADPAINPLAVPRCGQQVSVDCSGVIPGACVDSDGDGDPDETDCAPTDPARHHPTAADPFPQSANCCGYSLGKSGPDATRAFNDSPLCHPGRCGTGIAYDCIAPIDCKADQDCDTYAASDTMQPTCSAPANKPPGNDCNDCDPTIHPGAPEICGDKIDNNCNGQVDEGCVACDLDGDGYQRSDQANGCPDKDYPVGKPIDCDDEDHGVFPGFGADPSSSKRPVPLAGITKAGLNPVCNPNDVTALVACAIRRYCKAPRQAEVDCLGAKTVGLTGCPTSKCDADGDSFIDAAQAATCDPNKLFVGSYDCNDADATIFPGAPDKCGDGVAQNCRADVKCESIVDVDKDGYSPDWDENDGDPAIHPWAVEVCNGQDDNCDGLIDEGNPDFKSGKSMGTAAAGSGTSCNTSNVGACGPKVGHCVCSGVYLDRNSVYVTADRVVCPDDATAVDATRNRTLPRCYFAVQPSQEMCDGKDTSCTHFRDDQPPDHASQEVTHGLDSLMAEFKLRDCPGPANQGPICCSTGGGVFGCKDPATDVANCGNCNQQCSNQNGMPSCKGRVCAINCTAGFANCNDVVAINGNDGCEVNTLTDVNNCGAGGGTDHTAPGCGVRCSRQGIVASCVAGVCAGACLPGFADCNNDKLTDGCEVNTHDVNNCGLGGASGPMEGGGRGLQGAGCGCVCSMQQGTPACGGGACTIACNAGWANCDDLVGNTCGGNQNNGCEKNTVNDVDNCGAGGGSDHTAPGCGRACSFSHLAARSCSAGVCNGNCANGWADCNGNKQSDGCEVNVAVDPDNCGLGGNSGPMGPGGVGLEGAGCGAKCSTSNITPACANGVCDGVCAKGWADCNSDKRGDGCEVNTHDVNNCGLGGATGPMEGGGRGLQGAGCGCACSSINGTPACGAGACTIVCLKGFANCDNTVGDSCTGNQANGCETNTVTDPDNCGAGGGSDSKAPGCGQRCSVAGMAQRSCGNGVCNGNCASGFADCDGNKMTNGCEDNVANDPNNCGVGGNSGPMELAGQGVQGAGCGVVCSANNMQTRTCGAGVCNGTCLPGFSDCNNNKQTDGCEVHTAVDVANCGGCGLVCSANNIPLPSCAGGSCNGTCAAGSADCNNNKQTDGCEVNTYSTSNCGPGGATNNGHGPAAGCGCVCSTQNGTPACGAGACTIVCNAGSANCNDVVGNTCAGNQNDGCEKNTLTDPNNCGAGGGSDHTAPGCGAVCSSNHMATRTCGAGVCNGTCSAGWGDCNMNKLVDGCEANTLIDVNNCGPGGLGPGCGQVCSNNHIAVPTCVGGVCGGVCDPTWGDCNMNKLLDGCETDLNTSLMNCGNCGRACSGANVVGSACTLGNCTGTCAAGFADCNMNLQLDGCEVNLNTDNNHCGNCITACVGMQTCQNGTCI